MSFDFKLCRVSCKCSLRPFNQLLTRSCDIDATSQQCPVMKSFLVYVTQFIVPECSRHLVQTSIKSGDWSENNKNQRFRTGTPTTLYSAVQMTKPGQPGRVPILWRLILPEQLGYELGSLALRISPCCQMTSARNVCTYNTI